MVGPVVRPRVTRRVESPKDEGGPYEVVVPDREHPADVEHHGVDGGPVDRSSQGRLGRGHPVTLRARDVSVPPTVRRAATRVDRNPLLAGIMATTGTGAR